MSNKSGLFVHPKVDLSLMFQKEVALVNILLILSKFKKKEKEMKKRKKERKEEKKKLFFFLVQY